MPIFVEHWRDNFQFCPIFNFGGNEPRPRFFSGEQINSVNTKKNTVNNKFSEHQNLPNNLSVQTILKLLGRIQSNYWGGYISPSPQGFGTPVGEKMKQRQTNVEETDLWETIIRVEALNKA